MGSPVQLVFHCRNRVGDPLDLVECRGDWAQTPGALSISWMILDEPHSGRGAATLIGRLDVFQTLVFFFGGTMPQCFDPLSLDP